MANFDKAIAAIEKKIGKKNETIIYDPKRKVEAASTGSAIVDSVTGVGGLLVKRRLTEVFGKESCVTGDTKVDVKYPDGSVHRITMLELKELVS